MAANHLPMRLKDIADNLGLSQPTVVRYLRTLCDPGVLRSAENMDFLPVILFFY